MAVNVLMYTFNNVVPNAGGISRMVYFLGCLLERRGYNVYYLAFKSLESDISLANQYFFPTESPNSAENLAFLQNFVEKRQVHYILNHIAINERYTPLLFKIGQEVRVVSVLHNAVLNHVSNLAYQYEYELKKRKLSFAFYFLKLAWTRNLLEGLYICRHKTYYTCLLKNSFRIVVVSKSNANEFSRVVGTSSDKVVAISNFIKLPIGQKWKKEKIVLWCGRVETRIKRIDKMLYYWSIVGKKHEDWRLLIMGSGNLGEMKRYATSLKAPNVVFLGNVDTAQYYEKASILCHTSVTESFGLVLVEAMSYGVVPMAFNSFPACDDIITEESGVKISPFDDKLYMESLEKLMTDKCLLEKMSRNCRSAASRFGEDLAEEEWCKLLN